MPGAKPEQEAESNLAELTKAHQTLQTAFEDGKHQAKAGVAGGAQQQRVSTARAQNTRRR